MGENRHLALRVKCPVFVARIYPKPQNQIVIKNFFLGGGIFQLQYADRQKKKRHGEIKRHNFATFNYERIKGGQ